MSVVLSGQPSPERRKLRAQKGVAVRRGDVAEVARLDTEIRAARLAAHVEKALADAPPLTDSQRHRIARLLMGGHDDAA